ncbi:HECT-domain (ubiquitin-transferase) [Lotmaria passim]
MDGFQFHVEGVGLPEGGELRRANAELIATINSPDPMVQYGGLQVLCDQLTMSTFISPTIFATIPAVLPSLLRCIASSPLPEVSVTAARALTYILDAFPRTFDSLQSPAAAVEVLLRHLRSIEDVELSEQCISCLEIITRGPMGCRETLRNNGVEALLGFADFFTIHKQRQIWTIIQRLVREVNESEIKYVESSLPAIRQSMTNPDAEIRQMAVATLAQVIDDVRGDRAAVDMAFGDAADKIEALLQERDLNDETLASAFQLLGSGVRFSADIAAATIQSGLFTTLLTLLQLQPVPLPAVMGAEGESSSSPTTRSAHGAGAGGDDAAAGPGRESGTAVTMLLDSSEPPESATSPLSTEPTARGVGLTSHQRTLVCQLLSALLIPCRSGVLDEIERLEMLTQRSSFLGSSALDGNGNSEEGDDEDGEEDADEDYTTDDDDHNEGQDVEEAEGTAPDAVLAEKRQRVENEKGLKIQTKAAYSRCRPSGFICDGCGKSVLPGDWYRCNQCPDRDYCAACVVEEYKKDNGGQHAYTDMKQVVGATARNKDKVELYRKSPELLQRVLEAVPTVAEVCVSSEVVPVRCACLNFLVSAIDMATPEQLVAANVTAAALGDVLNNNLRGSDLVCNALAVAFAGLLLHKLGDVYRVQFVREGVRLSLQLLKQRFKVKGKAPLPRDVRKDLTTSMVGWRTLIGTEAAVLLHQFLSLEDEQSTEALRRIVQELRQDQLATAAELLRDLLAGDVTAFEFYSSGIVRELKNCLVRKHSVFAVMQLIAVLSAGSPMSPIGSPNNAAATTTATPKSATATPKLAPAPPGGLSGAAGSGANVLSRFVHHLQTVLTLLDNFTVPSYDFVGGVHKFFVVCFEPHRPSVAVPGDTTLSLRQHGVSSENGSSSNNSSSSTAEQWIKARIRPLSSVSAMSQVLQQEVLHVESEDNEEGEQDAEAVTNILPDLHPRLQSNSNATSNTAGSPLPSSSANARRSRRDAPRSAAAPHAPKNVWIRYGTHVLPLSMTMLQIMEHLVMPEAAAAEEKKEAEEKPTSQEAKKTKKRKHRHGSSANVQDEEAPEAAAGRAAGEAHHRTMPRDTSRIPGYSNNRPVVLYYSTTPYDSQRYALYKVPNNFPPSGNPQSPMQVRLPSQEMKPRAVQEVQQSLDMAFPYSKEVLTENQRDVLGLLRLLHVAIANWADLLTYLHKQSTSACSAEVKAMLQDVDAELIFNAFAPPVSPQEFQHAKLNNKAIQQCSQLLLAGQQRGTWAVKLALDCRFLFSFATRKFFFDVGFTSTDRCLIQMRKYRELFGLQDPRFSNEQLRGIHGQLPKESKRVWREDVLECAKKVLSSQDAKARNATWSFQFYNENGWGDGPTREFYTLVSRQLRERKLGLWRSNDEAADDAEYDVSLGLFPKPCVPGSAEEKQIVPFFRLMGRFIGRAFVDEHVPALPLSPVFIRLLRGDVCGVYDVQDISDEVGRLLVALSEAGARNADQIHLPTQKKAINVADLALDFTLPGDDSIALKPNGATETVTAANVKEYCDLVVDFLLNRGVAAAVQALRDGFHWYIPLVALQVLSVDEAYQLIAGHEKAITFEEFAQYSEANYGYTSNCKHVQWLFEILASFSVEEQKQFFLFLTGSAHLPVGGLGRLRPPFTVVRKTADSAAVAEGDLLPSAMTCQNYLKLPQYATKKEMEKKLRFAMTEGNGAFLLS